jgi:hypothetical protein
MRAFDSNGMLTAANMPMISSTMVISIAVNPARAVHETGQVVVTVLFISVYGIVTPPGRNWQRCRAILINKHPACHADRETGPVKEFGPALHHGVGAVSR